MCEPKIRSLPPIRRDENDELITVEQAAKMLHVSPPTIRRRVNARQFPAIVIGAVRIPRVFVEWLLASAKAGRTVFVDEYAREWETRLAEQAVA